MRMLLMAGATIAILAAAGGLLHAQSAGFAAEPYPAKVVRMIVPLAAGSTVDIVARLIGDQLGAALGVPVVIENRPGGGGVPGTDQLVRSPNDGSTIGMTSSNHVINPSIYHAVPFDSIKDITVISVLGTVPMVLVVNPRVPARDLHELVALAKAKPGELNYGSSGNGSALHLAGILFISEADVDIRHVPYRGQSQLANDLIGGHVEMGFLSVTVALELIRAGAVRPIGVSTPARVPLLPGVPSLAEAGLPNYSFDAWIAMIGPAGMPKPIVDGLYRETKALLATRQLQDSFAAQGLAIIGSDPQTSSRFMETELAKHARLAKKAAIKAN